LKSYQKKVVVITGSATGIGFALARQFGNEGARIVLSGRLEDPILESVEKLRSLDIVAEGRACDVTQREEVEALAEFAWSTFGKVDVIVNNAGISQAQAPIIEMDLDDFRHIHEVNLYGVLHGIQVFGKRFIEQGTAAAIYNIGSENSIYPCVPSAHAYVSSKHAILPVTELLAEEVPEFIEVAFIMPGLVNSEMTKGILEGMDTDKFASLVLEQLKAGRFYIVSHAHNKVRLDYRHGMLAKAFDNYAPRYAGDDEYDVRCLLAKMKGEQK
jgi:NAD(P)-dependent dehydrogenase (short-subunit alcohol dehydrogenase family)